nr:hypothetical protein [Bacteroidota bacterium]
MQKIVITVMLFGMLISAMMFSACQPKKPESVKMQEETVKTVFDEMLEKYGKEHRKR